MCFARLLSDVFLSDLLSQKSWTTEPPSRLKSAPSTTAKSQPGKQCFMENAPPPPPTTKTKHANKVGRMQQRAMDPKERSTQFVVQHELENTRRREEKLQLGFFPTLQLPFKIGYNRATGDLHAPLGLSFLSLHFDTLFCDLAGC
jgi:hypothetical protein